MVWMETFCFYCSVRLGVIVSALTAMVASITTMVILILTDTSFLKNLTNIIQEDSEYSEIEIVKNLLSYLNEQPENVLLYIEFIFVIHILTCVVAMIGAIKLNKWFFFPYIFIEFLRFIILMITHIMSMIILKKVINLGILIAATIAGGFGLFFVGYMWAAAVCLFQIINLVNSEKYKALYGDDPLSPIVIQQSRITTPAIIFEKEQSHSPPPRYIDATMTNDWDYLPKKKIIQPKNKLSNVERQMNQNNLLNETIRQHYRNWYVNELKGIRRPNVRY